MNLDEQLTHWDRLWYEGLRYAQELLDCDPWRVVDLSRDRLYKSYKTYGDRSWYKTYSQLDREMDEEAADLLNYCVMQRWRDG